MATGRPLRSDTRTHSVTRLPPVSSMRLLATDYHDLEDFSATHVVFEDDAVADIFASEVVIGGITTGSR